LRIADVRSRLKRQYSAVRPKPPARAAARFRVASGT
jgi:hypothetical protein